MKKLSPNGFAHQVLILALVVIAIIGGIGSYIFLRSSSAYTSTDITKCRNAGGVWYDNPRIPHPPCYLGQGAYLLSSRTSSYVYTQTGQTRRIKYPDEIIVVVGKWKMCDDKIGADICTYAAGSNTAYTKGAHHINSNTGVGSYQKTASGTYKYIPGYLYSSKTDVYLERL